MQETGDARRGAGRRRAAGRRGRRQRGARRRCCRPPTSRPPPRAGSPRAEVAAGLAAAGGLGARRRRSTALLDRGAPSTPSGWRSRRPSDAPSRRWRDPTYELPLLAEGVDLGALYELAERLCATGRSLHGCRTPALRPRRRDRRPGGPASSSAAAPAGSARPPPRPRSALRAAEQGRAGRGADDRPGPPAGAVDGARRARQHPAPGDGRRRLGRRLAGRDDAGHEADLRRGRPRPRRPPNGPRRSWTTRSTSRCRRASPARRSTWRWRSSASCGPRTAGT